LMTLTLRAETRARAAGGPESRSGGAQPIEPSVTNSL
jgi:hypothetical protein